MFKRKILIVGLSLIFIGAMGFILGLNKLNEDRKLNSFGKTAEVTHIEKVEIPGVAKNTNVDVYFKDENGEEQRTRLTTPLEIQQKIDNHEKVSIDYLPAKLSVCRWTGSPSSIGIVIALVNLGAFAFGL